MTETGAFPEAPMSNRHHVALHLAHRRFVFFEAPGGNLEAHLTMFHPQVQLSGHRGSHLFARDHESLKDWFAAVPDVVSSHHIVRSDYSMDTRGGGLLNMAPLPSIMQIELLRVPPTSTGAKETGPANAPGSPGLRRG